MSYTRVCACGDTREVQYVPTKDTKCAKCSRIANGRAMSKLNFKNDKVRYSARCLFCGDIRHDLLTPRKGNFCGICTPKVGRKKDLIWYFDMKEWNMKVKIPTPRHFRICKVCGDIKEVKSKQSAGMGLCPKHKLTSKSRKQYDTTNRPKKTIEKAIKANREHREYVESEVKEIPKQSMSDADMTALWLANNKVTVIERSQYA